MVPNVKLYSELPFVSRFSIVYTRRQVTENTLYKSDVKRLRDFRP